MKNKRIVMPIKILVLILCVVLVNKIIVFCTYERSEFAGTVEQIYGMNDNIDVLLLGSSHADVSFDEKLLSELWNKNVFNAGTPVQKPDVSYYILKEALKTNDIEKVYLDMFYYMYRDNPESRTNAQLEFVYIVSDEMKWSLDKVKFLLDACPTEGLINGFVKGSRDATNIMDLETFERIIKAKRHTKLPEAANTDDVISEREYSICVRTEEDYQLKKDNISDYSYKYLEKMVKLCREENIELVLVTTPMTDYQLSIIGNYDDYISDVREFADKMDVYYRDYNLCKHETLNVDEGCFSDIHHLNSKGTKLFTETFVQLENDKIKYEDCFYDTYQQKMQEINPDCFGINVFRTEEGDREIIPVCSQNMELDYEVITQGESINLFGEKRNKFKAEEGEYIIKVISNESFGISKQYRVSLGAE